VIIENENPGADGGTPPASAERRRAIHPLVAFGVLLLAFLLAAVIPLAVLIWEDDTLSSPHDVSDFLGMVFWIIVVPLLAISAVVFGVVQWVSSTIKRQERR